MFQEQEELETLPSPLLGELQIDRAKQLNYRMLALLCNMLFFNLVLKIPLTFRCIFWELYLHSVPFHLLYMILFFVIQTMWFLP